MLLSNEPSSAGDLRRNEQILQLEKEIDSLRRSNEQLFRNLRAAGEGDLVVEHPPPGNLDDPVWLAAERDSILASNDRLFDFMERTTC